MNGDNTFTGNKRALGWAHNRSSYWYNNKGTCEDNIISQNNIQEPGDDDDITSFETQDGHPKRKDRNVRIDKMSNFQQFDMVWLDPLHGGIMTTTTETHGIGAFIIQLPDQVNWTTFHDIVFLISPHNSTFYTPGTESEATEIFVLSNEEVQEEVKQNDINLVTSFEIFVYPNPTADKVKIDCSEKIITIEICNIMGDKISEIQMNAEYGDIDMTKLSKGVYIFKIITQSKTYISRVIYQ
jgi:hypothetical protein